jgi:hypothetical protein
MAQSAMFLARMAAAVGAGQLAVAAQWLVTDLTFTHFVDTVVAKEPLAINAGKCQAIFVSQMAIVAQVEALAGLAAYLAVQRLYLSQQRVPDSIGADLGTAVGNLYRLDQFGLLDDQYVEQGQVDTYLIAFGQVSQFVAALTLHGR